MAQHIMSEFAKVSGWGGAISSEATVHEITAQEGISELLAGAGPRGLLPAGLHRSYGDSALNSGGELVRLTGLKGFALNLETGVATVGAGLSIRELESLALASGYFPPVVPGTGFVTIGGAIAADIHGKSHHQTGSFSAAISRIKILTSDGSIRELNPADGSSHFFWATVGGLGLTGLILEADIHLIRIPGNTVEAEEIRAKNLDQVMSELLSADKDYAHTVAWIDFSGSFVGRGKVSKANYGEKTVKSKPENGVAVPAVLNRNFINSLTVRTFNEAWFRKPLENGSIELSKFMHPLDGVQSWNRVYGRAGFIQYQCAVPDGEEGVLYAILEGSKRIHASSFLTVLKRFGAPNAAPLSFPIQGWTLAIDFPVGIPGLSELLDSFDALVAQAHGRIYLIKDSRARAEYLPLMYPRLAEWRAIREEMDPSHTWQSDQSRRLGLC